MLKFYLLASFVTLYGFWTTYYFYHYTKELIENPRARQAEVTWNYVALYIVTMGIYMVTYYFVTEQTLLRPFLFAFSSALAMAGSYLYSGTRVGGFFANLFTMAVLFYFMKF